jgi:hypothetical protein
MARKIAAPQALSAVRARKNGPVDLARPRPRATVRPGGEADLTRNAWFELNKGVWLGCHGGALTLFHPEAGPDGGKAVKPS